MNIVQNSYIIALLIGCSISCHGMDAQHPDHQIHISKGAKIAKKSAKLQAVCSKCSRSLCTTAKDAEICLQNCTEMQVIKDCLSMWRTTDQKPIKINTSNGGKKAEFMRLFKQHNREAEFTEISLREFDSDPISVVVQKAIDLGDGILVEDTSLDVEGANIGVNVKHLMDNLPQYVGRKAIWTVLLAERMGGFIYIYKGVVHGQITPMNGTAGFGFDPVFTPFNPGTTTLSNHSLAESKPDTVNARALAVDNYFQGLLYKREAQPTQPYDGFLQKE